MKFLEHPLVILGAFDLFLTVMLSLGVVTLYPLVRFRAALGLGFLGFIFFAHGQSSSLMLLLLGSAGLYLSTVFVGYVTVGAAALAGLAGMGLLAWRMLS
jgi:hypothetical protein